MFKGFYNLTSGMLTQGRRLDVVANNMVNVGTAGYKSDRFTASTFREVMISRIGNEQRYAPTELGRQSYILAPSRSYTDYTQGLLEETGLALDFAIEGDGFFAVQTQGGTAYTRAGSFSLDEEGFLCLPGQGRVLSSEGQPIALPSGDFTADPYGGLYGPRGDLTARIGVYAFEDNAQLNRTADGLFTANGQAAAPAALPVHWKTLERSNVDLMQQMSEMLAGQRLLQSGAQIVKIYDQVMSKATSDIGQL